MRRLCALRRAPNLPLASKFAARGRENGAAALGNKRNTCSARPKALWRWQVKYGGSLANGQSCDLCDLSAKFDLLPDEQQILIDSRRRPRARTFGASCAINGESRFSRELASAGLADESWRAGKPQTSRRRLITRRAPPRPPVSGSGAPARADKQMNNSDANAPVASWRRKANWRAPIRAEVSTRRAASLNSNRNRINASRIANRDRSSRQNVAPLAASAFAFGRATSRQAARADFARGARILAGARGAHLHIVAAQNAPNSANFAEFTLLRNQFPIGRPESCKNFQFGFGQFGASKLRPARANDSAAAETHSDLRRPVSSRLRSRRAAEAVSGFQLAPASSTRAAAAVNSRLGAGGAPKL